MLGLLQSGCIPAMIVAQTAGDDDKAQRRLKWQQAFDIRNDNREAKGLKPLDWCKEVRKWDPDWAKEKKCPEPTPTPEQ